MGSLQLHVPEFKEKKRVFLPDLSGEINVT